MLILSAIWRVLKNKKVVTQTNLKITFIVVLLVCVDDKFTKPIVVFRGKNAAYKFIKAILEEHKYYKK